MATSGKAYVSRSSQGRPSASTAHAREYRTGDMNWANLLLNLVQIGLFEDKATWCISAGRLLGGTILFGWSDLVWIAYLLPHSAGLGCVGPWESPVSWSTRWGFTIVDPTSCLLPCLCKQQLWCCLLLWAQSCLNRGLGTLLGQERPLLVPGSLYATCFILGTRSLYLWYLISERPSFFCWGIC